MKKISSNLKTILLVFCLLFVIIISGILMQYYLVCSAKELNSDIETAYNFVNNSQWDNAKEQLIKFEANWKKTKHIWNMLLDHFEIDNIDDSFIKSMEYIESQDLSSAVAELKALRQYVMHIPRKEKFSLENILHLDINDLACPARQA